MRCTQFLALVRGSIWFSQKKQRLGQKPETLSIISAVHFLFYQPTNKFVDTFAMTLSIFLNFRLFSLGNSQVDSVISFGNPLILFFYSMCFILVRHGITPLNSIPQKKILRNVLLHNFLGRILCNIPIALYCAIC